MKENLANMIKVKTVATLLILIVWAALALTNRVPADNVNTITLMVVAFYFGTQHEKKKAV